jgi:phosphate transport system ATP-binding protein
MQGVKIRISHLNFYYREKQILSDISLDILEHQVTALIGPTAGGKSSFLRCLNRMHEINPGTNCTGRILLNGVDIHDPGIDPAELRCQIGLVLQQSSPFPKSVFNNVAYGLRVNGWKDPYLIEKRVQESLEGALLWGEIKDELHAPALKLSSGQQKQLCIARALAVEPEVVLLDEPGANLDPVETARIEELIRKLKETCTVIFVTQNLQEAARASDRTAFFLAGRLIEVDETERIFTNPGRQETEDYVTGRFG